jgi:hypothetical protein
MKLSIIPSDKAVYKDGLCYSDLDLSSANIPADIHALQWDNDTGHIEYKNNVKPIETIDTLPSWADAALALWEIKKAKPSDEVVEIVNVPLTDAQKLILIRIERNTRLSVCDWTQLLDAPNTVDKEAWAAYRQALRDLPDNITNVDNVFYPIPPSA